MTDKVFFSAAAQDKARQWIDETPGNLIGLLLPSGHTEFLSAIADGDLNDFVLKGAGYDGTPIVLSPAAVVAYYLLDKLPEEEAGTIVEAGQSADLEAWQAAMMELRAAADESTDQRVKDAAARLDRVEGA